MMTEEQKQKRREYDAKYKRDNRQRLKEKMTDEQKEKRKEYLKKYNEANKQKKKEYYKQRNQLPEIKQKNKINEWKRRGLVCDNYDDIYNKWLNTTICELCNIELQIGKAGGSKSNTKCMDHCHTTGNFRNIICHSCNTKRR